MKDPVTGGDYIKEKEMYIRYHGLTEDEADLVMAASSYKERDAIFSDVIQKRWDSKPDGYFRLIDAINKLIEKDGCQCNDCKKWIQMKKDWLNND
jgi:hypothetical protein